jgi:glycosyltransferase involved in cell wall biosynthesis
MRVDHVLNSSLVSGPETLLVPNLAGTDFELQFVLLQETRVRGGAESVAQYVARHGHACVEVPVRGRWDASAVRELRRLWRTAAPDVVHAHGAKATALTVAAFAGLGPVRRPRLVTTHHGVSMNDRTLPLRIFEWVYERYAMPRCDLVLTVCEADRALLLRRGVRTPVRVHWNGVDRRRWGEAERAEGRGRARAAWSEAAGVELQDRFVVGLAGRLSGEKRQALAVEAIASLRGTGVRPALVLAGSGPDEHALRARVTELGLTHDVAFLGWRTAWNAELPGLDLLLSVSSAEGLPIALVEAGWAGVPVMATQVGGVTDLLPSADYGYPLPASVTAAAIGQAIEHARDDRDRATRASAFGARIAADFSRSAWLDGLHGAYAGLSEVSR